MKVTARHEAAGYSLGRVLSIKCSFPFTRVPPGSKYPKNGIFSVIREPKLILGHLKDENVCQKN